MQQNESWVIPRTKPARINIIPYKKNKIIFSFLRHAWGPSFVFSAPFLTEDTGATNVRKLIQEKKQSWHHIHFIATLTHLQISL